MSSHANLCHIRFNHMYRFNMIGMEGRNKGGLMNLVSEGYPTLSLIALSINNLRFVPPQSNQHFIGVLNEPSVMGVVKGYDSQSQHPYWLVDVSIIPCEPIQLRLPMTSSETNANYGGIAGYAFGIEPLHSSVCSHSQFHQTLISTVIDSILLYEVLVIEYVFILCNILPYPPLYYISYSISNL